MATSECKQNLIWKLQKKIPGLDFKQLKTVACEIGKVDKEWMRDTSTMSEPEVYNLIVNFVWSDKLKESKDEGWSDLLHLLEVVENLLRGNTDPEKKDRVDLLCHDSRGSSTSKVSSQAVRLTDLVKLVVLFRV